jgi:hypothetical protein
MHRLPEVEEAKALMTEAIDWSVMKWLWEKQRVRQTADNANAVLDKLNRAVKSRWSQETKAAHRELVREKTKAATVDDPEPGAQKSRSDGDLGKFIRKVQEADDKAHRARMDAEQTFDEAERLLSTSLAREGCKKAIRSWELHEKAIRCAEAGVNH